MSEFGDVFDVVVVGGGPGGSSTAGLLAQRGHRVLVLEREKFPRYHIGESLITGVLPTIEELGLRERLDQMGFTRKYGGTLLWGKNGDPAKGWRALGPREVDPGNSTWDFRFKEASNYDYSYQVRRADFDALLLTRARELGAVVREEATVRRVVFEGERAVGVEYTLRGQEQPIRVSCGMVVDATGQSHMLAKNLDLIDWHEDLRNIAVWTYFQGCKRYSGTRAGDILTENRPNGWFWFIPLSDGTTSVGYVTPIREYQESGMSLEELHKSQLAQAEEIRSLTEGATRVAAYRTIKDWYYTATRFHGPGWALVGDAAAFIDPLLSTGVTLAMRGAKGLAETVDAVLANPDAEAELMARFEANYRDFLEGLLEFIRFFYDRSKAKEDYWDKAQQTIDPERTRERRVDFATMLSGLTGLKEIFEAPVPESLG